MNPPGVGRVIAGRYRLTQQLGQGGMGSVWRAEHLTLHSEIAIKLIDPEIAEKPDMLERFQREAQGAASLRSPHVVQVLDYGVDETIPFIAMELLDGETLAERLKRVRRLSPLDTVRVITHVARALMRAHEAGIIHRDLKPDNVFLVPNDDHDVAKVLDFGVAKHSKLGSASGPTRTGLILGTPAYMSPEQAQGTKTVDTRSDLWSLGVIAHECILGRVPFESEALGDLLIRICVNPIPVPSEVGPVPAGFDAWFARACCRDTEQRFQTAKELADALRQVLTPDTAERASGSQGIDGSVPPTPLVALAVTAPGPARTPRAVSAPPPPDAASQRLPGATVPGMSLALQASPQRSAPLVAGIALVTLLAGAGGAFLLARRQAPMPEVASAMRSAPTPEPSATHARPAAQAAPSAEPTVAPAPTAAPSVSAAPSSKPRTRARPPSSPQTPAPAAKEAAQLPPAPPASPPPGDQRLGF